LNQPLAIPWLMLAVPPQFLAVMLAVPWLLSRNSQITDKPLNSCRNSTDPARH